MKKIWYCIIWITTITTAFAQQTLTTTAVKEDFQIFKTILTKGHPALHDFIPKKKLNHLFDSIPRQWEQTITDLQLFNQLSTITDRIRDGHLLLFAPPTVPTDQYYFPLILKIIQKEFYTDTDDFGIPVGSKILSINGYNTTRILEDLKKYTPTDGWNRTRKYRDIELKFGAYYSYAYGITKQYTITYVSPQDETQTITLPAITFATAKQQNMSRASYFSRYHKKTDKIHFFAQHINQQHPFVYYKNNQKVAVLVVNSFGTSIPEFKNQLIQLFKDIRKKKAKHLIIDIRHNNGGFRPNAVHLYAFITNTFFKQRTRSAVVSLTIPAKEHMIKTMGNPNEFIKDKFYNHPTYNGWQLPFDDLETMMVPATHYRFEGNVYVLTSGTTFSAASSFALLAKNNPSITLVGEETGGGYYAHTGQFPVHYKLPNSKIVMVQFMEKIEHFVTDTSVPKGSGVPVDRKVQLTVADLIKGKDTQLDYLLRYIGNTP